MAISGRRIVVGASGSAYVITTIRSRTHRETKLTASGGFGSSVAISGRTIAIGAPGDDDAGIWSGSVHVFRPDATGGYHQTKLTASDASSGDMFGGSVAIAGSKMVIGAPVNDLAVPLHSGSAYLFTR